MRSPDHLAKRILTCTVEAPAGPINARLFIVDIAPHEFRATSYVALPLEEEMGIRFHLGRDRHIRARITVVGEKQIADGRMHQMLFRFLHRYPPFPGLTWRNS